MKKIFVLIGLFISLAGFGQAKDTLNARQDSVATMKVVSEIYNFMQDKNVGVKDYMLIQNILNAYMREKFIKPKK